MRHVPLIILPLLAIVGCSASVGGDPPTAATHANDGATSVDEILRQMNDRYASAKTYSDEGTLHEVTGRGPERRETTARLRTRWVAPNSFHFDFHSKDRAFDDRLAIWSREGSTKSFILNNMVDERSLDHALATMQGVSHGMTGLIPRWLTDRRASTLLKYELRGERACGPTSTPTSTSCFMLLGRHARGTVELGVDTRTFALRTYAAQYTIVHTREEAQSVIDRQPLERRKDMGDGFIERWMTPLDVEETLTLEPVFDAPIAATAFDAARPLPPL